MATNFNNESLIQQNASSHEACHMVDLPFPVKVTVILVFSVMLLFSLVGNALIIIMVFKRPELKNTTNFFIVNMALCAIVLTLTSTPVRIEEITIGSYQWNIGIKAALIFCKLSVFVERLTIAVSVESLCWIALDRFLCGSLSNEGPWYLVKMSRPSYHLYMDHRTRIKDIRPVYGRDNNHCRWTYVHKTYRHYCVFVVCSLFSNCTTYPHDNPILCFIKNWIIV